MVAERQSSIITRRMCRGGCVRLLLVITVRVIWNYEHDYPWIVRHEVLLPINCVNREVFKWLSKNQNQLQLLRPITTAKNSAMNQSQFLAITCNSLEAREKSRVPGAIGFGFASHWLKNWRESFKPIIKRSNRNYVITFDSHLKTALTKCEKLWD